MADPTQENNERELLKKALDSLIAIKPEDLVRTNELGQQLDFSNGVPYFRRTLKLYSDLAKTDLSQVPYRVLNQLRTKAESALATFGRIRAFSPAKEPSPSQVRDSLINEVRDRWDDEYQSITPVTAYLIRMGTDFEELERRAKEHFSNMARVTSEEQEKQRAATQEMQETLEKVKRAAAEVGVAQHAIHFREATRDHEKAGRVWLTVAAAFALCALVYSLWSFRLGLQLKADDIVPWWPHLKYVASRLLVLSILLFGMAWSAKNYRSQMLNSIVNRHRQNALSTFETFVKAATDKETKDAVLLQATKSIFEGQSSGYLSSDSEQLPSNLIVEVLRRATGGKAAT
jgi:hypothetical protein